MITVDIPEAKKHLSKLVQRAVDGEAFIIAKAGTPLVRVSRIDAPPAQRRVGFLSSDIAVPDDFDRMGEVEIAKSFGTHG